MGKDASVTKFSNYMCVSNNLTPTPGAYQKAYKKYRNQQDQSK